MQIFPVDPQLKKSKRKTFLVKFQMQILFKNNYELILLNKEIKKYQKCQFDHFQISYFFKKIKLFEFEFD